MSSCGGRSTRLGTLLLSAAAALFPQVSHCQAQSPSDPFAGRLATLPGLQSILVGEKTGVLKIFDLNPASIQARARLTKLSEEENDFSDSGVYYDVFYSKADGTPDAEGNAVTIEVADDQLTGAARGEANIAFVALRFGTSTKLFADRVFSASYGTGVKPDAELRAIDTDELSSAPLGQIPKGGRLRVTVGFKNESAEQTSTAARSQLDEQSGKRTLSGKIFRPADGPAFSLSELVHLPADLKVNKLIPLRPSDKGPAPILILAQENGSASLRLMKDSTLGDPLLRVPAGGALSFLGFADSGAPIFFIRPDKLQALEETADHHFELIPWGTVSDVSTDELFLGNFDGDAPDDVLRFSPANGKVRVLLRSGSGQTGVSEKLVDWLTDAELVNKAARIQVVDLDRDGLDDLTFILPDARLQTVLTRPDGKTLALGWYTTTDPHKEIQGAWFGNPNTDGSRELLFWQQGGLISRLTFRNGSLSSVIPLPFQSFASQFDTMEAGDFDGDGAADFVGLPHDGKDWLVSLNAGGFRRVKNASLEKLADTGPGLVTAVTDLNQDGLDDLVVFDPKTHSLLAATSTVSEPVSGLLLRTADGKSATSGPKGDYQLELADNQLSVKLTAGDSILIPSTLQLRPENGKSRLAANLFVLPMKNNEPRVCLGYPGTYQEWGTAWGKCAPGYALYAFDDPSSITALNPLQGTCCPLPADDMLTDESVYADSACPEGMVITSGSGFPVPHWEEKFSFRCTKLNNKRYQLGPLTKGFYWGIGYSVDENALRIDKSFVPPGLRFAAGRVGRARWDLDGCIGKPWGSLLVSGRGRSCSDFLFRQVQYNGAPGDPPAGTPVQMFADCKAVRDVFDPLTTCDR